MKEYEVKVEVFEVEWVEWVKLVDVLFVFKDGKEFEIVVNIGMLDDMEDVVK